VVAEKKRAPGIVCPICGRDTAVSETRQGNGYIRRRRLCDDYRCSGKLTTFEVVYNGNGMKHDGLVLMPKDELERMHFALGRALGFPDDIQLADDGIEEPVSPSE
jgi:hypothetical protein